MIPRRPERVAARGGRQQHEPPGERPARQPPPRRVHALEERRLRLLEPARLDVRGEGHGRPVVGQDVVPLHALLVEPEPPAVTPAPELRFAGTGGFAIRSA